MFQRRDIDTNCDTNTLPTEQLHSQSPQDLFGNLKEEKTTKRILPKDIDRRGLLSSQSLLKDQAKKTSKPKKKGIDRNALQKEDFASGTIKGPYTDRKGYGKLHQSPPPIIKKYVRPMPENDEVVSPKRDADRFGLLERKLDDWDTELEPENTK